MKLPTTTVLYALLVLVGLADAAYLTWDHYQFLADPEFGGGFCGVGSSCDISRMSAASEISMGSLGPGLPVALLAIGYYLAVGALAWRRKIRDDDPLSRRLLLGLCALGLVYPVVLLVYSLVVQGSLCPFCTVLYVVNLLLFCLAFATRREPLKDFFGAIPATLISRGALTALAVFIVSVAASYAAYAANLSGARHDDPLASKVFDVVTEGRLSLGPADAPVHIIEFADIQCPHCRQLFHTVEAVHKSRPDDVRVTFMHFPLDNACNRALKRGFHPRACQLAKLSECGARQGKGFQLLGTLFDHQRGADNTALFDFAAGQGLDTTALHTCLSDPSVEAAVKGDIEQGLAIGVTGTPVFLINGHLLVGARSQDYINRLVDRLMKRPEGR